MAECIGQHQVVDHLSKLDLNPHQPGARFGGSGTGRSLQGTSEANRQHSEHIGSPEDRDSGSIEGSKSSRRSRRIAGKRPPQAEWEQPPATKARPSVGQSPPKQHPKVDGHQTSTDPRQANPKVPRFEYSASFDRQPPKELRPRYEIPAYAVRLYLTGKNIKGRACPLASKGTVNAIACLIMADGHSLSHTDVEMSRSESATAPEHHKVVRDDTFWTLRFPPRAIDRVGFFRIRVNIFYTPVINSGGGNALSSPILLLTAKSRVFHVHTFASLPAR